MAIVKNANKKEKKGTSQLCEVFLFRQMATMILLLTKMGRITWKILAGASYSDVEYFFYSTGGCDNMMKLFDHIIQIVRSILKRKPISNYQGLYYLQTPNLKTSDFVLLDDYQKNELETIDQWYLKGRELMKKARYQEASLYFDQVLEQKNKHLGALKGKGYCLFKMGSYRNALAYFSKALAYRPKDTELLNNIGVCHCKLQEHKRALQYFEKALRYDPRSPVLWNNKGYCLVCLRCNDGACAAYQKALDVSEREDPHLLGNAASVLMRAGKYRDAMYYFDRALQLTPLDPLLLNNVAVYLAIRGNYDSAIKCCSQALALEPENPTFLCNKGMLLIEMGKSDEADLYLREALDRDRTNAAAWMGLAVIYLSKGSNAEALDCFNRSLGLE